MDTWNTGCTLISLNVYSRMMWGVTIKANTTKYQGAQDSYATRNVKDTRGFTGSGRTASTGDRFRYVYQNECESERKAMGKLGNLL